MSTLDFAMSCLMVWGVLHIAAFVTATYVRQMWVCISLEVAACIFALIGLTSGLWR